MLRKGCDAWNVCLAVVDDRKQQPRDISHGVIKVAGMKYGHIYHTATTDKLNPCWRRASRRMPTIYGKLRQSTSTECGKSRVVECRSRKVPKTRFRASSFRLRMWPGAVNYSVRCASRRLLNFPRYNMSNYGRRAFCFAGPRVWNSLPEHIRQSTSIAVFKRSL